LVSDLPEKSCNISYFFEPEESGRSVSARPYICCQLRIQKLFMKRARLLFLLLIFSKLSFTQRFHAGIFGGLAAYNGDLADKIFPKKVTNGAVGVTGTYELTDNLMLRAGFTFTRVGGADRFSNDAGRRARNLNFETAITEFSLVGQYYLLNLYDHKFTPYAFAGVALYHFNPYTYNSSREKVYLKPLGTEGQGIPGYGLNEYKLTQFAIPFGGGVKYAINNNWHIGLEAGLRVLFTDHLDDVSTNYADPADLLAYRGQQSVDLAYRGDEVPGGSPVSPGKGNARGSAKYKDFYYFTGLHLTFRLNSGKAWLGAGSSKSASCPTNF
jgi:opacity protein-like surface antigen